MGATLYTQASLAVTAGGVQMFPNNANFPTCTVDIDITVLSGSSPTLTVFLEREGADGVWYPIYSPSALNATGLTSTSVGPGCPTNAVLTSQLRFRWLIGGTSTPTVTFSVSIIGRP